MAGQAALVPDSRRAGRAQRSRESCQQGESARKKPQPSTEKRRLGRPKGSKNKAKAEVTLTPELLRIQSMIDALLHLIAKVIPLTYLVLDGHFGNHNALRTAQQCHLHLISKLRSDSALYMPYEGPYAGTGPHRKYGSKLDYRSIPEKYLKATTVKAYLQTALPEKQRPPPRPPPLMTGNQS